MKITLLALLVLLFALVLVTLTRSIQVSPVAPAGTGLRVQSQRMVPTLTPLPVSNLEDCPTGWWTVYVDAHVRVQECKES